MSNPQIGFYSSLLTKATIPFNNEYSMNFDGVDEGVTMLGDAALDPSGSFSVSIWVKGTSSSNCYLFSRQYIYIQHTGVNKIRMRTFSSGASYQTVETGTVSIYDGNWHNILVTYQIGGRGHIFLDGVLKTNPAATQPSFLTTSAAIGVGMMYTGTSYFYTGQIDEFAYWHDQDMSANAAAIYDGGTPNDLTSLTPSVWLRMGELGAWGTQWTFPNQGTTGSNDGKSINMEEADRLADTP